VKRVLKTFRKKMVVLVSLLRDHRLNSPTKLGIIALPSNTN
jgi:hypothetical protein